MNDSERPAISRNFRRLAKDYVFWRDILSTLIGGLFVLIVAYTWAVLTGYLSNPGLWESVANFFKALTVPTGLASVAALVTGLGSLISTYFAHRAVKQAEKSLKRNRDRDI